MANLSKDIQCAGFDTRPPMLDRTDFASWQQRIRLYCRCKENGVNILKSIDEGPFQMGIVREPLAEGTEGAPHLDKMSRDVITVGSTMQIPLLFRGEYSQWSERFMNYLEEQTDGEAMINSIQNDENPIRTLGDYSRPSHEGYQNNIELPDGKNVVPLRSDTIRLVQNGCSFHGLRFEDPNQDLKDFLKLWDSLDLYVPNRKRTRLHSF
nr:zinc finger, CCHC-type [Tanacetum cinerariifolium]